MSLRARVWLLALWMPACEGPEVPLGALPPPGTEDGESAPCPDPLPVSWLFCEDFEAIPDPAARFFEYDVEPGVVVVDSVGASGQGSLQVTFDTAQVGLGWINISVGRNPVVYSPDLPQVRPNQDFDELFVRSRLKMEEGWPDAGPGLFMMLGAYANAGWGHAARATFTASAPEVEASAASCVDESDGVVCDEQNSPDLYGLADAAGTTPLFSSGHADRWHCVEAHMKLNGPGSADGVLELWIDGELDLSLQGLDWRKGWVDYGINLVQIVPGWWSPGAPGPSRRWIDDLVISAERIGCD